MAVHMHDMQKCLFTFKSHAEKRQHTQDLGRNQLISVRFRNIQSFCIKEVMTKRPESF